ncbi:preprotein translocase subunit YajC [Caldithrix abyssi]|uniref:Sec translocon accessory complex subunit YajC n=1 Tax=Caldithrix abyssi DSM 13497 TaxID=880073 RepID=H1XPF4_CALAY|nr:preprotein translocase subunit YajC [Caldithrix abyssi]APF19432.1 protein translocase subunit yajC [Caldithrix abyssi DSM 13497]EHO43325.1 preprotein translocase, YajC subunit [Caldithrix abyssi DSM 13497]
MLQFIMLMAPANQGGAGGGGNPLVAFLPFILIIVIMYFLMIRPQAKRQKEKQKMLEALQKGDQVITMGGIHGKVVGFTDDNKTVIIKVDDNVKLNIERSAINVVKKSGSKN